MFLAEGYRSDLLADVSVNEILRKCDAVWFRLAVKLFGVPGASRREIDLMRGENWFGAMPDGYGVRRLARRAYHTSIFRYCSAFLTIGIKNKEYYLDHGVSQARLFDMPYAVDNQMFLQRASNTIIAEVRQSLDVTPEQKMILYAGKLQRRKNPHHLLEALKTISHNAATPAVLVSLVMEKCAELEVEAAASGLNSWVLKIKPKWRPIMRLRTFLCYLPSGSRGDLLSMKPWPRELPLWQATNVGPRMI